jgi:hypothetical protein
MLPPERPLSLLRAAARVFGRARRLLSQPGPTLRRLAPHTNKIVGGLVVSVV